jgi:hypothetical protein
MRRLFLLGALVVACSPDPQRSAGPLSPDLTASATPLITGAVLGPDGSNICSSFSDPFNALVVVRPIQVGGEVLPNQFLFCPENSFAINLESGNYVLRAALPDDPAIGTLPTRTFVPIVVQDVDITQNIVVQPGLPLGGSASLDSAPFPGVDMTLVYGPDPRFGAAFGASGSDGSWTEFFRPTMILQPGVRYQRANPNCSALGTRTLVAPPLNFLFPTEVSAVNCTLEKSPSIQFSHTHTRLALTPMPGEIGGQSSVLNDRYGIGWGMQFPVEPGQSLFVPATASHLFGGGLLIGIAPDRILSGIDLTGQVACSSCQDLGLDAVLHYTPETNEGRTVTWRYTDAGSAEAAGLRIVQRSYDGQRPNDYVLFQFSIQNTSARTLTFYAGDFMDWDVDEDASDDVGFIAMDGRLMAVFSAFEGTGIIVGSLLLGAPVSGISFWRPFEISGIMSTAVQFQALSGARQETETTEGDVHYIQGAGPITLKRGQKVKIWIAIVAGENHATLIANAQAAEADVARRQADDDAASDGTLTLSPVRTAVARPSKRVAQ